MSDNPQNDVLGQQFPQTDRADGTLVPLRGNPALASATRLLGCWDAIVVGGICAIWGYLLYRGAPGAAPAALIACGASAAIAASAWFGLHRASRASMDSMMAWVMGAFLLRVLIVAVAVVLASQMEVFTREIAWSIVVTLVLHSAAEVWILSRARVVSVVPLGNK